MKNILSFLMVLTLPFMSLAQTEVQTLNTHLLEVNGEWKHLEENDKLQKITSFENDTRRIQSHLSEVKDILQERNTDHLCDVQKENRHHCLDILEVYQEKGVFPQNIYHKERTPYFIDHLNTHCAVGHLMNETGYGQLARKIADESNYRYVKDLVPSYPEILDWAEMYGFTEDELAWIQPTYQICSDDCDQLAIADIYSEFYFGPFTYLWSPGGDTTSFISTMCPGTIYTVTAYDSEGTEVLPEHFHMWHNGAVYDWNTVEVTENSQAQLEISTLPDSGMCNGSASFEVTNDVMVTEIVWDGEVSTSYTALNLCTGWHALIVETNYECIVSHEFFIEESEEPSLNILSITNDTLCAYQCIDVEFETSGFPESSLFGFQLSDVNGIFDEDTPLTIGGSTTDSSGSTVCCAIWAEETGTGYRMRIINLNTGISQEFDQDLTIYVVDYEVVSSPGMLEVVTDIPETSYSWSNCPGNIIPGETDAQFTSGIAGNEYSVNLIQNGCPTNSGCVEFEVVDGIYEGPSFDFEIFPNPNDGSFKIMSNPNLPNCTIQISDELGRTVYLRDVAELDQTELTLDISSGIYIVEVRSNVVLVARKKVIVD